MPFRHSVSGIKTRVSTSLRNVRLYARYPELLRLGKEAADDDSLHLDRCLAWLSNAQDSSMSGGIPAAFSLLTGTWGPLYRETTGYSIPTFLAYARLCGNTAFRDRAIHMGTWERTQQAADGAIGEYDTHGIIAPKIFNTSQVILGFCALYDETGEQDYLEAACTSADWIVLNQESSGEWRKYATHGPRTYDSRVAWALLETYRRSAQERYRRAAEKNLIWVRAQQRKNGWFENCSLRDPEKPWTHTIAYSISGLWESGSLLKQDDLIEAALRPARAICDYYMARQSPHLPGTFDPSWNSSDQYACLTGDAQMATAWLKMYHVTGDRAFRDGAQRLLIGLKQVQVRSNRSDLAGGIPGSYPISGAYASYALPNWSVKFFADALLLNKTASIPLIA